MSEEEPTAPSSSKDHEKEEDTPQDSARGPASLKEESPPPNSDGNDEPLFASGSGSSGGPPPRETTDISPTPPSEEGEVAMPQQQQQEEQQRHAVVAPLPLDWTRMNECDEGDQNPANIVRHPWDVAEIDPDETYLSIVGTSSQKITRMGSDLSERVSPNLTHLVLRSHLISTMEGIGGMEHLEVLELYDNVVDELRELGCGGGSGGGEDDGEEGKMGGGGGFPGRKLRVLDISYNVIRDMGPASLCPNLQELYIAQNKIKNIRGIKHLKLLRKIDLGANRIREMDEEELSGLENLEELWLGKNKIEKIGGLSKLTKLRTLDVQSNRLTRIENLEAQVNTLEELYLAHNGIDVEGATCDTGLALPFKELNTIDMSRNRLTDTSPFAHLNSLTDLWISGNDIKTFEDVNHLGGLTELDSIYMEYNPVASEFEYRKKLAEIIPSLSQIDADMIGGPAQHGYPSASGGGGSGGNSVVKMRQMQETAFQKAKAYEQKEATATSEEDNVKEEKPDAAGVDVETASFEGKKAGAATESEVSAISDGNAAASPKEGQKTSSDDTEKN